ncbi:hypothetical protein E6P09_13490 [Haloferax mediterranei ATCC 33500]|uniref:Uncharacterized protein n=1 Tax=Haloferax mediterranei (strain ATCC 33500 / DSM 1411 / JCM 8866 / NBRC 14739 / NCIMB 2177 / R-4) TaxID=523841 RepID=I3R7X3_HALMT|nr:hypothetical protein [Haloferax mediterranei]AFK20333.1 hypothetical protein HFX_2655 [Haloferax mediterranei ATCC 33500]AHZ23701.1 hypothetical protein BM92_14090 [Haloferax mediterranei ATCC 33500]ELZ99189.1 hypothetical protein C439_15059 [Haloferax mediterranei ATCC 33500]MDX5986911.1 hypothetical protein [Haloferax mediterranei ATCC 33500]QCQ76233.1 hypothetical protein E6P09_13490 [Haloferax mediterranei ATCC 33500]
MVPLKRLAAVVALLLVGVLITQSFSVAGELQTTYVSEEATAETAPELVAAHDSDIVSLSRHVNGTPQLEAPVETAAETGTFDGQIESEAYMALSDINEDTEFAVYGGQYYRLSLTVSGDPVSATLRLSPTDWETVSQAATEPAANASANVQAAIDDGSVDVGSFVDQGLFSRGGTSYLVYPENIGAVYGKFFSAIGAYLFNPVGWAYTIAGIGLLVAFRSRGTARPLDQRTALAVIPGTLLALWLATTLTGSGSLSMRYVLTPASGVVAAFGLFAGFCLRRRAWKSLVAGSVILPIVVIGANALLLGAFGAIFSVLFGLFIGGVGSLLLVPYGYVFAADPDETVSSDVGAVTAAELIDD